MLLPQAVDKNTLLQLRGSTAKGYAFDRRYGQDGTSDDIYNDVVTQLVEKVFKVGGCRCDVNMHSVPTVDTMPTTSVHAAACAGLQRHCAGIWADRLGQDPHHVRRRGHPRQDGGR